MDQWGFNPNQLATWAAARELVIKIDKFRQEHGLYMGGGVSKETNNPDTSGIYVPTWVGGPGGFPEPKKDDKFFLHLRFNNGRAGLNVGLVYDKLARFNNNEMYVFYQINNVDLS